MGLNNLGCMQPVSPVVCQGIKQTISSMSIKIILPLLFSISFAACKKQTSLSSFAPSCILNKIDELKNKPRQNPPAEVYEYNYLNKKAYYFTSDCCDQYNFLYDNNCNVICAPDGGLTGGGDGKCADFNEAKREGKLIWKDQR